MQQNKTNSIMQNLKDQLFGAFKQLCFVGLMGLFVVSCIDEKDLSEPKGEDEGNNNPELSPDFSTKKVVQIDLSYDVPTDFRVAFELYTQSPVQEDAMKSYVKDSTLLAHVSGKTDDGGKLSLPIEVASFVEDIYVYSPTTGVPMLLHGKIKNGKVKLSSATSAVEPAKMASTRANLKLNTSDGCCYGWGEFNPTYQTLGEWDANGKPNALGERTIFSEEFNDAVNRTISPMKDNDGLFMSMGNQQEIRLTEPANVRLYFVKHNSARKNALAYYTYEGNRPTRDEVNNSLVIAYPNLDKSSGLASGDCVVLKYRNGNTWSEDFPADVKIGFALILDAYENKEVTKPAHIVYSNKDFNAYSFKKTGNHDSAIMGERPQMVTFKADGHFVIAFEDMPRGGTMPGSGGSVYHPADYSDDVFVLYSNPITALPEVPDVTPGPEPEPEPDLKISTAGYYAFEDNWPKAGDYDMNDVVLKYTRDLRCDKKLNVTGIDETYEFISNGASYANAFGYEIKGVRSDQIREAKVTSTPSYTCAGQGLDAELSDATIMLFNNGKEVPLNTVFGVKTRLNVPLAYVPTFVPHPVTKKIPYNPFIVIGGYSAEGMLGENRAEVHLPKYTPTPKANVSLFGTDEDISDPAKNIYYVRKGNKYPFALELTQYNSMGEFKVPAEKEAVDIMYPKFNTWVAGGCGETDSDWYLHPIK